MVMSPLEFMQRLAALVPRPRLNLIRFHGSYIRALLVLTDNCEAILGATFVVETKPQPGPPVRSFGKLRSDVRSLRSLPHPNAKYRSEIIPGDAADVDNAKDQPDETPFPTSASRISWARLLKRVFDIDIEHCPHCGGHMKIIAAIEEPTVIAKILAHLGLPTRAPPRSPPQKFSLFATA